MATDAEWLAAAARLAIRARPLSRPNPGVGAIIVNAGEIVGRGWTQPGGRPHAEAMTLAMAGEAARGATLYCTLEPCAHVSPRGPSCSVSIVEAGLARCVFGVLDPDPRTAGKGLALLRDGGVDAQHLPCTASRATLAGYLARAELGRPHVTLKLAASADGCLARPEGQPQWITGEPARAHVHAHRALADAILVGGGTWRVDRPRLDVRLEGLEARSPRRVVLSHGAIEGVATIASPEAITTLDGVQYLYVEGGAATAQAFLEADLVDRVELYRAPFAIGGPDALAAMGLGGLDASPEGWVPVEQRRLGSDSYAAYDRIRN
ncbi:bifunctional diaminohydroxyphosphoribosylaminopyrimidine deaminase/5-amino-6-(5-phosphoribosylamino)uracil reductase RibD [Parerythrobacter lacustris]|uniref:Riboflavin biosynthesis protein RibD n=1 Tax=Parerythrobacter lacustris TaxID=2969984 RepID=A0ABT1XSP5_9SPHN|nr:bifunctional diaminohydroxyphosphoribosylaminopyrimidine deaminase/5-amino-6-(5-phosphoribosylamino)uracil reductase RibD [Parerythrobacter lacustris]MCR2834670.1 bifunctional diaminohydroxyphosphoribosylaminopyrimidine deaminase/5-amino-6-(5-phosphoribosylamino)uracil reductase RibD [Parerythrobacter lacustris]